ncbi:hypothetical protein SAMN06893096_101373 [Geodermatophilus pulveris]|uniref:Uncharacterized protein n=1 Tax=Geodermatophilus pulveris TaxID=1564159 RepID=A0A239B360_9ACTN|nr:hypothetical protein [Geodermatophilus pulveris]SNS01678.1 hypothetical protein SAMN06893096_101373 [Geodermatophilus pulveris]
MDPSVPAAVPWLVLVLALLGSAGLAAAALGGGRRPSPGSGAPGEPRPVRPVPRWRDDDLPGFLESPPGTPPAPEAPPAAAEDGARVVEVPDGSPRAVAGMAAVALLLVAALAGLSAATRGDGGAVAAGPAPGTATPAPAGRPTPPAPPPDLPAVPADPLPGEGGAGVLADRSVPLGEDGVVARLAFGGVVVERQAVGTTVAYPSVSVTAAGDGATALGHLLLPTWNCLAAEPPVDPAAAGCVRSRTEYADLPSPALAVTREGRDLRLAGRFPSYTRPIATPPAYTGRVYDLAVTVSPAGPVRDGWAPAAGTLFLGTDRAASVDAPGLNAVRYAG